MSVTRGTLLRRNVDNFEPTIEAPEHRPDPLALTIPDEEVTQPLPLSEGMFDSPVYEGPRLR